MSQNDVVEHKIEQKKIFCKTVYRLFHKKIDIEQLRAM